MSCLLVQQTYYAVLQAFAKSNQIAKAEALFAEMKAKGMVNAPNGYSIRMNGYGRVRDFEAMEAVFTEMQEAGIAPDEVRVQVVQSGRLVLPAVGH